MNTKPEAALYDKPAPDTRASSKLADIIVLVEGAGERARGGDHGRRVLPGQA